MYYVYILQSSRDGSLYVGYSHDLQRRFREHNTGLSSSTKSKRPWKLVYYEAYRSRSDAKWREHNLKRFAKGYAQLKKRIQNCLST
ncbi:MAG: hypothetical protein A3B31_00180 [Candidatus Komeilibacteria bacterium RIFCSPLOWO2_01_FULL_53_11]|uniref:GIY-YIG domain-containing protein n=1 Tax=Candidatus Komeilibacteria bacterium RIFCSPLOWO2_01_FULL_53_11 TaxID=1798552 RepID=A0A1G2BVQ7_9BACT|nr:MAG: hypothetical protein A3B31_00180 [Candidatus Komeilibacteria bacterium RIFCSPLOWO2_01_FULL_53_11]